MSSLIPKGLMDSLYLQWEKELDQRSMSSEYRKLFEYEADNLGFERGKRSFILTGQFSNNNASATYACLSRGGYSTAYLDAYTLVRRLSDEWVPGWTEADDNQLTSADIVVLTELFALPLVEKLTDSQRLDLMWYVVRCIEQERVLILPMPKDVDLNFLGEDFGDFIENNFEVFQDGKKPKASNKKKRKQRRSSRDSGDAASS